MENRNGGGRFEIAEWVPTPLEVRSVPQSANSTIAPRLLGTIGTLLLHIWVVYSALPDYWRDHPIREKPPDIISTPQFKAKNDSDSLILLEPQSFAPMTSLSVNLRDELAPTALSRVALDLPSLTVIPMAVEGDTDSNQAQAQAGDTAEFAALTGRYHGQIDARIERAWRRPRSPVEEGKRSVTPGLNDAVKDESSVAQFSCAVRIIQDPRGNVSEVQLLACNGSTAWKQSLISAILTASPLPAPPDPKVFSSGVTLVFTARQYTSDESTDAYEPAVQSAMRP